MRLLRHDEQNEVEYEDGYAVEYEDGYAVVNGENDDVVIVEGFLNPVNLQKGE